MMCQPLVEELNILLRPAAVILKRVQHNKSGRVTKWRDLGLATYPLFYHFTLIKEMD